MKKQIKRKQIVEISIIALVLVMVAGVAVYSTIGAQNKKIFTPAVAPVAENGIHGPSVVKGDTYTPLEPLFTVPNKNGCTNLNSVCIDGKTLYCIKIKGDNSTSELYKFDQFESSSRTLSTWSNTGLYHANGLTFVNGDLYVATMQVPDSTDSDSAQIWKLSTSGKKSEAYRSEKETIYSISHYVGDTFLVGLNGSDANKKEYAVATLSDGKINLNKKFYVNQMLAFGTGQDIFYHDGFLYIPTWGGTTANKVLKVNIGESVTDGKNYEPEEVIEVNTTDSSITKLEVESLDVDESGRIVICTNFETTTDKNTDKIFR